MELPASPDVDVAGTANYRRITDVTCNGQDVTKEAMLDRKVEREARIEAKGNWCCSPEGNWSRSPEARRGPEGVALQRQDTLGLQRRGGMYDLLAGNVGVSGSPDS